MKEKIKKYKHFGNIIEDSIIIINDYIAIALEERCDYRKEDIEDLKREGYRGDSLSVYLDKVGYLMRVSWHVPVVFIIGPGYSYPSKLEWNYDRYHLMPRDGIYETLEKGMLKLKDIKQRLQSWIDSKYTKKNLNEKLEKDLLQYLNIFGDPIAKKLINP